MLSDADLTTVLQKLGIAVEPLAGESPSRVLRISQFQEKAAAILRHLAAFFGCGQPAIKQENDSSASEESTNGENKACCVKCLKFSSAEELLSCSLPCKARFHSTSCSGKVFTSTDKGKLTCCLPCTGIILLCSLTPEILTEDNRKLLDKVRPLLSVEQRAPKLHIAPTLPSALQLGAPFLKPGIGLNISGNGNENYFKQLNQLQMLSHQLSGSLPAMVHPNTNFALAFQQQVENTQNIFQLWGSLGASQGTTQTKRKGGEAEDAPPASRQKVDHGSGEAKVHTTADDNETKANGDAKKSNLNDKQKAKQRRTRWLSTELETLWKGILLHGNRWYEVKNKLPGRTYYQVKDKGRRLLYTHGWKTGRLKNDNNGAYEDAKAIARLMLAGDDPKPAPTEVSTA